MNAQQYFKTWFKVRGWRPFAFQKKMLKAFEQGYNGVLNAPTGTGKTYGVFIPFLSNLLAHQKPTVKGLQLIWITPLRALSKDICNALQQACYDFELNWRVEIRTGDTPTEMRQKQRKSMPQVLVTTPESIHIMMASKQYAKLFTSLECAVVDEWHELLGTKRGIQVELLLSRFKNVASNLKVWGISATVGNMDAAMASLLGSKVVKSTLVTSTIKKKLKVVTLLPKNKSQLSWGGHLGIKMLPQLVPILNKHKTTLIFTNTRSQCEIWFHALMDEYPELAGSVAIHHGSLSREIRNWVEDALQQGILKAVICTSSLDLGIDFRPVEAVVQIGGPKGIARFVQRAGRSGHQPKAKSVIYFLPTHSMEIMEGEALKSAVKQEYFEDRLAVVNPFDVLVQYMVTLAVSDGFVANDLLVEIKTTQSFSHITDDEWHWCLGFITNGSKPLRAYENYAKVVVENGWYKVNSRKVAMRHRLNIGTIIGDPLMLVKYKAGTLLGSIEERFIKKLNRGDVFWFSGKPLQMVQIKEHTVYVKKAKAKDKGRIPVWGGGKMPLSAQLGRVLRQTFMAATKGEIQSKEIEALKEFMVVQSERSLLPAENQTLIEKITTDKGCFVYIYPFEGRFVHEIMGNLLAYRISEWAQPITCSIAANDYGFELAADKDIQIEQCLDKNLFTTNNLINDLEQSLNLSEMAQSKFRGIALIAGLIFQGYPGKQKKERHLEASSSLLFKVFNEYDPANLLIKQAYQEVFDFDVEEARLRTTLERIYKSKIILKYPEKITPFSYPIHTEGIRGRVSYERIEDQIERLQLQFQ